MNKTQIERACLEEVVLAYKRKEEEYFNAIVTLRKTDQNFKVLDDVLRSLELENAKKPSNELAQKLESAKQKVEEYLKSVGIQNPQHICQKCNDTGFVNGQVCSCLSEKIYKELTKQSGIALLNLKNFEESNFELFEEEYRERAKKIYAYFKKEVDAFNTSPTINYVVCGKPGAGKTFLFSAIAGELLKAGVNVLFTTSFSLNETFLKYHTTFSEDKATILAPILDCEALLIDDLGTEQILNNVTIPYLLMVLKERKLSGKKTFINTNLMPATINDVYGERIYSRLFDKTCSVAINFENSNLRV